MDINSFINIDKPILYLSYSENTFNKFYESTYKYFENDSKKFVTMIDGERCHNQKNTFKEFSRKMKFPDYFGYNWDAFDECLNDLEWLDCKQYVLFIKDFDLIFESNKENLELLLTTLFEAAKEWEKGREYDSFPTPPTPFHIIIHSNKDFLNELQLKMHYEQIYFF